MNLNRDHKKIVYFISSHGFGHASRACAVMNSLNREFDVSFTVVTSVPKWMFLNSLKFDFDYYPYTTDIGLVQNSPFEEDIPETLDRLFGLFPFRSQQHVNLIRFIEDNKPDMIISDISPIGIEVAKSIGLPAVLIENFTWDWIYASFADDYPGFKKIIAYLKEVNSKVDLRLQTQPLCISVANAALINPIARKARTTREEIRKQLGVLPNEKMGLITMGGIPAKEIPEFLSNNNGEFKFVFPVGSIAQERRMNNLILLPHNHAYFHPDLVNASDFVIAKAGYSTIAEVFYADVPFLYLSRKNFRETGPLVRFIEKNLVSKSIEMSALENGELISEIKSIMAIKQSKKQSVENGADQAAALIKEFLIR